jgi:hypothetical protein
VPLQLHAFAPLLARCCVCADLIAVVAQVRLVAVDDGVWLSPAHSEQGASFDSWYVLGATLLRFSVALDSCTCCIPRLRHRSLLCGSSLLVLLAFAF